MAGHTKQSRELRRNTVVSPLSVSSTLPILVSLPLFLPLAFLLLVFPRAIPERPFPLLFLPSMGRVCKAIVG